MQIYFAADADRSAFEQTMLTLKEDATVKAVLVLACDANGWQADWLDPLLQQAGKPVLGGIFPQIIYGAQHYEQGYLCLGLGVEVDYCLLPHISELDHAQARDELLATSADAWQRADKGTLVVFVDGLATRIGALLDALFDHFALDNNIIGGGAGSLSLTQQPCLITPQGLVQDAALLINLPRRSALGVAHGWEAISSSFKVTEAEGNLIKSLDWRPALEVYAEVVGRHAGQPLQVDEFFVTSKAYPFGINKISNEMVVRDPIAVDPQGGLVCVGEVPEGCFVRVLHGHAGQLIAAAQEARETAERRASALELNDSRMVMLVDCISRALFLGQQMTDELQAVANDTPSLMVGALTLGEIANSGNDYLDFYNKTCVVGLIEDAD